MNSAHKAGDEALKAVAQQLNNLSRNNDYVIRLGGDEFVILIPSLTTLHFIEGLAERIRKGINNAYEDEDNKITLSASIGVSIFPDNGNTLEKLMETADVAMYKAKKQGKNRFQFSRASNH